MILTKEDKINIAHNASIIAAGYVSTINSQVDYERLKKLAKQGGMENVSDWVTYYSIDQAKEIYLAVMEL